MYSDAQMPERRRHVRSRTAIPCMLELAALGGAVDGMLREMDSGGARVKLSARGIKLKGVVLIRTGATAHGRFWVVWQEGQQVGLQSLAA